MAADTSGLLCAHGSPGPSFMCVWVCQCSLCWVLGSLKSLLNSLSPYDIKQTRNSPSLHLCALSLIHFHITLPPSFFYTSILGISLFFSLPLPPNPQRPRSSLSDVVSFQERLPSLLPDKNTISPFTSFSVSPFISPPLLFSSGLIPL